MKQLPALRTVLATALFSFLTTALPATLVINEYAQFHDNTGETNEFIEVADSNGAALTMTSYRVLVIEGDNASGSNPGEILAAFEIEDPLDANGIGVVDLNGGNVDNGSITIMLVQNFTGSVGNDVDSDNDAVIDTTFWTTLVDAIGVSDGFRFDRFYADIILSPTHAAEGETRTFAASRIPNANTIREVQNDDGEGWLANDPDFSTTTNLQGTAINTPSEPNQRGPVVDDAEFTVAEDEAVGFDIGTISAEVPGGGASIDSYEITSGNTGNVFSITSAGLLEVAGTLDFESTTSYTLEITVTDDTNFNPGNSEPGLIGTGTVTITIEDVPEPPTVSLDSPDDGDVIIGRRPTVQYDTEDPENNTIATTIEFASDSGFSNIALSYTTALTAEGGNQTYQVGQAAGGGTYNTGDADTRLAEGTWYWRARGTDSTGLTGANDTTGPDGTATFDIRVPEVILSVSDTSIEEGTDTSDLTITLVDEASATPAAAVTSNEEVSVEIDIDGTVTDPATVGASEDFTLGAPASGSTDPFTVTFAADTDSSRTVTITTVDDSTAEDDEEAKFDTVDGDANDLSGTASNNTKSVTITDDDTAFRIVTVDSGPNQSSAEEATTNFNFTIERVGLAVNESIAWSITGGTAEGADFNATGGGGGLPSSTTEGTVDFTTSDSSKTFSVPVLEDTAIEGDETFEVTIVPPSSGVVSGGDTATGTIQDDDNGVLRIIDNSLTEGDDGSQTLSFTLELRTEDGTSLTTASADVGVTVNTSDDTATAGSDYTGITSGSATITAGNSSTTIDVTVAGDEVVEDNETFDVVLSAITLGGASAGSSITFEDNDDTAVGTITDDDTGAVVVTRTTGADDTVGEPDATANVYTVTLNAEPGSDVVITVTEDDADGDLDYSVTGSTTLDSTNYATGFTVTVNGAEDDIIEGNETFTFTFDADNTDYTDATQDVTVNDADDDNVEVEFASTSSSVGEDAADAELEVRLTGTGTTGLTLDSDAVFDVTVTNGTAENTDYAAVQTTVTFSANFVIGTTANPTISVNPTPDTLIEGDETLTVTLASVNSGDVTSIGTDDDHVLTIEDADDDGVTAQFASTSSSVGEDAADSGLAVELVGTAGLELENDATFSFAVDIGAATTAEGTDYALSASPVTFSAGYQIGDADETITFNPTSDDLVEGDEDVKIDLSYDSGAVGLGTNASHTVTIEDADDDAISVQFALTTSSVDEDAVSEHSVTVELVGANDLQLEGDAVFAFAVDGASTATGSGTDYALSTSSPITFADGFTIGTTANPTIDIDPTGDSLIEGDETVVLTLSKTSGIPSLGTNSTHTVTINEVNGGNVTLTADNDANENNPTNGAFTVKLPGTETADGDVTVSFTVQNGGVGANDAESTDYSLEDDDGASLSGSVVIDEGENSATIVVIPADDDIVEIDEDVRIVLTGVSPTFGGDLGYDGTEDSIQIIDGDTATLTVAAQDSDAAEESENAGSFRISTDNPIEYNVTVGYAFSGSADTGTTDYDDGSGAAVVTSVTLTGNDSAAGTVDVTFTPVDDALVEGTEDVVLTLGTPNSGDVQVATDGTGNASIDIADNDTAEVYFTSNPSSIDEGSSDDFVVNLTKGVQGGVDINLTIGGTAANGTDYDDAGSALSTTVSFGDGDTSVTVDIDALTDDLLEGDETIIVGFGSPVSSNGSISESSTQTVDFTTTINDTTSTTVEIVKDNDAAEADNDGAFTVRFVDSDVTATSDLTVNFSVLTGNADDAEDEDYDLYDGATEITGSIVITSGTKSATITVDPLPDELVETDEKVRVQLDSLGNTYGGDLTVDGTNGDATVTITDPDTATLTVTGSSAAENTGTFTLTLTLDAAVEGGLTVDLDSADGSATAGSDYTAVSTTSPSFGATTGDLSEEITLTVAGDSTVEQDETFTFTIVGGDLTATNSDTSAISVSGSPATVTIVNDDQVTITIDDVTTAEDSTPATFTVNADNAVQGTYTVNVSTSNGSATAGSDFTAVTTAALNFAGTANEDESQDVAITDDDVLEPDEETFTLGVASVSNLPTGISSSDFVITDTGTGTITDDDTATIDVAFAAIDPDEVNEGADSTTTDAVATISVNSASTVQDAFSFTASTSDGTAEDENGDGDYDAASDTINLGGANGDGSLTVTVNGDDILEDDETLTVELDYANFTPPAGYSKGDFTFAGATTLTILNDDTGAITINSVTMDEGDSGTTNFVFTVTLDTAVPDGLKANLSVAGVAPNAASSGSDFTTTTGSVTFEGTAGEEETFTVEVSGDTTVEEDQTFEVSITSITRPDDSALPTEVSDNINTSDTGTGTITNDDTATLAIDNVTTAEGTGGGPTTFTFDVTLTGTVEGGVDVDATTGDPSSGSIATAGTDYTAAGPTKLTFAGTDSEVETFSVSVTHDAVVEPDEVFAVNLSNLMAPSGVSISDDQGIGTIVNDDEATISVVFVDLDDDPDSGGDNKEGSGTGNTVATFEVTLSADVQGGVSVLANTSIEIADSAEADDFTALINELVDFSSGTATTLEVEVPITRDSIVEADETFTLTIGTISIDDSSIDSGDVSLGTDSAQATITDDDAATLAINDRSIDEGTGGTTTDFTFTVTLTGAVEDGVTVEASTSDPSTGSPFAAAPEDYTARSATTLTFTGTDGETQTFTVTVNHDNKVEGDELFAVDLANVSADGDVTIAANEAIGTITNDDTATITVIEKEGGQDNQIRETEADQDMVFLVQLSAPVEGGLTVDIDAVPASSGNIASEPADFSAAATTVSFGDNDTTDAEFTVSVKGDATPENDEDFVVDIGFNAAAEADTTDFTFTNTTATIVENDVQLSIAADTASQDEGNTDTTAYGFTVTRTGQMTGALDLDYYVGTDSGKDGDHDDASLDDFSGLTAFDTSGSPESTIVDDGASTTDIDISIQGDTLVESDEAFSVFLVDPASNTGFNLILDAGVADGVIGNDDSVTITIDDPTLDEGDAGPSSMTFTVSLSGPSSRSIQVDYATADDSAVNGGSGAGSDDYESASGTLTFAANDTEETFTVTINEDRTAEATESFNVNLSNEMIHRASSGYVVSGADLSIAGDATGTGVGTITDDDDVEVRIVQLDASTTSVDVGEADGSQAAYTIELVDPGTTDQVDSDEEIVVTVTYSDDDTTEDITNFNDGSSSFPGAPADTFTITFDPGDSSFSVEVTPNDDSLVEATESFPLTHSATSTRDSVAMKSGHETAGAFTVNILDDEDDRASVQFVSTSSSDTEGTANHAITVELVSSGAAFTLQDAAAFDIAVAAGTPAAESSDYSLDFNLSSAFTFAADAASGDTQDITVDLAADTIDELDEQFVLTASPNAANTVVPVSGNTVHTVTINDDDTATVTVVATNVNESVNGTFTIDVEKDLATEGDVRLDYTTGVNAGDEATKGDDYSGSNGTLTWADGNTDTQQITLTVIDDTAVEGAEIFFVDLVDSTGTPSAGPVPTIDTGDDGTVLEDNRITILDDDIVTFDFVDDDTSLTSSGSSSVDEDVAGGTHNVYVRLNLPASSSITEDLTVDVILDSPAGTAIAGAAADYTFGTGQVATVTFSGGDIADGTVLSVPITINNDTLVEADEAINLVLDNPTGTGTSADSIDMSSQSTHTVTILDEDVATLTIGSESLAETDAVTTVTVTVTLSGDVDGAFSVPVTSDDDSAETGDSDYDAVSTTLNFDGDADKTQTFLVTINGDTKVEADEVLKLFLGTITGDGSSSTINTVDASTNMTDGRVTILNDDTATITIADNSVTEPDGSDTTTLTFTVSLSDPVQGGLTVDLASAGVTATSGTDFDALSSASVTFTDGSTTDQTVDVTINGDDIVEADETFTVSASGVTAGDTDIAATTPTAGAGATFTFSDTGTGTITDNDSATISITASSDGAEDGPGAGGNDGSFTISSTAQLENAVTVNITVAGTADEGTDYATIGSSFSFPALSDSTTITVDVTPDDVGEPTETVRLALNSLSGAVGDISIGAATTDADSLDITDDDTATVTVAALQDGNEDGPVDGRFTVSLSNALDADVTVTYSRGGTATEGDGDTDDYTDTDDGSVTIGASNTSATIDLTVNEDALPEGDETVTVTLSSLSGTGAGQAVIAANGDETAEIDIIDNDTDPYVLNEIADKDADEDDPDLEIALSNVFDDVNDITDAETVDGSSLTPFTTSTTSGSSADNTIEPNQTSDLGSDSIRLFADNGNRAGVVYTFDGGSLRADGHRFSIELDNGVVDTGGTVGFDLLNADDERVLTFRLEGDDSNYEFVTAGSTEVDTGVAETQTGIRVDIELTSSSAFTADVVDLVTSATSTVTGALENPAGGQEIAKVDVFNNDAGLNNHFYLNSIVVAPAKFTATSNDTNLVTVSIDETDITAPKLILDFQPDANGSTTIDVSWDSPEDTATDTFTITVDAVNDTPTITEPAASFDTDEDTDLVFDAGGAGVFAMADVDSSDTTAVYSGSVDVSATLQLVDPGDSMTLITGRGVLTATASGSASVTGSGTNEVTITGTLTDLNNTLDGFTYEPPTDYNGEVDLLVTFDDNDNLSGSNADSPDADETVSQDYLITINAVNDAPVAEVISPVDNPTLIGRTPELSFNITDVEADDVGHRVQIGTVSDFTGGIVVDFESARVASDGDADFSFQVGQAAGSGTYHVGDAGTRLVSGTTYYWRVLGYDDDTGDYDTNVGGSGSGELAQFTIDLPDVTFSNNDTSATEGGDTGSFDIDLDLASNESVTVGFEIDSSSDTSTDNGTDVSVPALSVTFTPGQTSKTIIVTAVDDSFDENAEDAVFGPTAEGDTYTLDSPGSATVTVIDNDDPPTVSIAVDTASDDEDNASTITWTVSLSAMSEKQITVNYAVTGDATSGTDFTDGGGDESITSDGTVTFAVGNISETIVADITSDTIDENAEDIVVTISNLSNVDPGSPLSATHTILDDDDAPHITLTIDDVDIDEAGTAMATVTAEITAGGATESENAITVTLGYTGTAESTDYTAAAGTHANSATEIEIPAGQTSGTVTVVADQDTIDEPDETVIVDITNVVNGDEEGTAQVTTTIADDDDPPAVVLAVDNANIDEDGDPFATFTASFTGATDESESDVTVDLAFSGTAEAGDYTKSGSSITISAGDSTGTITVTAVDDTIDEPDETVIVDIDSVTNGIESDTQQATTTIADNDAPPEVALSIGDTALTEDATDDGGSTSTSVTATLDAVSGFEVTVNLSFAGDAVRGVVAPDDYAVAGSITIPAGQFSASATLSVIDDTRVEDDEDLTITLDSVDQVGGATVATIDPDNDEVTATITSDDIARLSLSSTEATASEPDADANLVVSIAGSTTFQSDTSFTISYSENSAVLTEDFTLPDATGINTTDLEATFTFPADSADTTLTVAVENDNNLESDGETVDFTLLDGSGYDVAADPDDKQRITIDDDDSLKVSIEAQDANASEPDADGYFRLTLSALADTDVAVTFSVATGAGEATRGADYEFGSSPQAVEQASTPVSGNTIVIPAGELFVDLTVEVEDDAIDEADETVDVTLTDTDNDFVDPDADNDNAVVTIVDDTDQSTITIADVSVNESAGTVTVAVNKAGESEGTVEVSFATADDEATTANNDYTSTSGSLTWASNATGDRTFTVAINDDAIDEADEDFLVNLALVSGQAFLGAADQQGIVTIVDDDTSNLTVADITVDEDVVNATVTVAKTGVSEGDVTVDWATDDNSAVEPGDYTASSGTVTFTSGSTTSQTFTVPIIDDGLDENSESFVVNFTGLTGNATMVTAEQQSSVTITDNDTANITIDDPTADEGDLMTFTVSKSGDSQGTVVVSYSFATNGSAVDPDDFLGASNEGIVSWAEGDTTDKTFTVQTVDENPALDEDDETFLANLSLDSGIATISDGQGVGTILDDDPLPEITIAIDETSLGEPNGANNTAATITIELSEQSGRDVTFVLTTGGDATEGSGEDYTLQTLTTVPAGDLTATADITVLDDSLVEGSESLTVTIGTIDNATLDGSATVTAAIADDETAAVAYSSPQANVTEGDADQTTVTFTLALDLSSDDGTPDLASDIVVGITEEASGTATGGGDDYDLSSSTVTFDAATVGDDTTGTFDVVVEGDTAFEDDETVVMTLGINSGTASITAPATHTLTIDNDDAAPEITLSATSPIAEAGGVSTITATATPTPGLSVTVNLAFTGTATGSGTDYTAAGSFITIPAGSPSATTTVTAEPDTTYEGDETIIVDIDSIDDSRGTEGTPNQVTITITEDDVPPTVQFAAATSAGQTETDADQTVDVAVTVSEAAGVPVSVNYTASGSADDPDDFGLSPASTLTFSVADMQSSLTKNITVTVKGDNVDEQDDSPETLTLTLSGPSNATLGGQQTHDVSITDDDYTPEWVTSPLTQTAAAQDEGVAEGTEFFDLDATDDDGDTINYTIDATAPVGLSNRFTIDSDGRVLASSTAINYETDVDGSGNIVLTVGINDGTNTQDDQVTLTLPINDINDAPEALLQTITVDVTEDTSPVGDTTEDLFVNDNNVYDDPNSDAFAGVAVVDNNASVREGVWEVNIDGEGFQPVGGVSTTSALVLDTDDLIRFVPAADYTGSVGRLLVRMFDGVTGTPSTNSADKLDISANIGGSGSFSDLDSGAGIDHEVGIDVDITDVNDSPVVDIFPRAIMLSHPDTGATGAARRQSTGPIEFVVDDDLTAAGHTSYGDFTGDITYAYAQNGSLPSGFANADALIDSTTLDDTLDVFSNGTRDIGVGSIETTPELGITVTTAPYLVDLTVTADDGDTATDSDTTTIEIWNPPFISAARVLEKYYVPHLGHKIEIAVDPTDNEVPASIDLDWLSYTDAQPKNWTASGFTEGGRTSGTGTNVIFGPFREDEAREQKTLRFYSTAVDPADSDVTSGSEAAVISEEYVRFNGVVGLQRFTARFFGDTFLVEFPEETYDAWRNRVFGGDAFFTSTDEENDFDGDGILNVEEYWYALDPTSADDPSTVANLPGPTFTVFESKEGEAGIEYAVMTYYRYPGAREDSDDNGSDDISVTVYESRNGGTPQVATDAVHRVTARNDQGDRDPTNDVWTVQVFVPAQSDEVDLFLQFNHPDLSAAIDTPVLPQQVTAESYDTWKARVFGAATTNIDPDEDFDGDSILNFEEYFYATDPTVNDAGSSNLPGSTTTETIDGTEYAVIEFSRYPSSTDVLRALYGARNGGANQLERNPIDIVISRDDNGTTGDLTDDVWRIKLLTPTNGDTVSLLLQLEHTFDDGGNDTTVEVARP